MAAAPREGKRRRTRRQDTWQPGEVAAEGAVDEAPAVDEVGLAEPEETVGVLPHGLRV